MTYCLIPELANKFLQKVRSGEIDVAKLAKLSSEARRASLAQLFADGKPLSPIDILNAKEVNALIEKKLILKSVRKQLLDMVNDPKYKLKTEVKRDFVTKVNNMKDLLTDIESFKADLVEKRLGFEIKPKDAEALYKQTEKISELEKAMESGERRDWRKGESGTVKEMEYGMAVVQLKKLISKLKGGEDVKSTISLLQYIKENPRQFIKDLPGAFKSLKSTFDNSFGFRQGLKLLTTRPKDWLKLEVQSFKDIINTFKNEDVIDFVDAQTYSHPLYKEMMRDKLAVGVIEEAFPPSELIKYVENLPALGKIHKASNVAYEAFAKRARVQAYEYYTRLAEEAGYKNTEGMGIANLSNSLTGRGNLGRLEAAADVTNTMFFSPRNLKSHIDYLTAHLLDKNASPFVRKQAAINLIKTVGTITAILTIADAMYPGSVDSDPRSSNFGKIKVGNTRFDVSGGMSSLLTLGAREFTQSSKSATTGKVSKLNTGKFGAQTGTDVLYSFFENKLSPTASVIKDVLKGQDFSGEKLTIEGELGNLVTPLPIANYIETSKDPKAADLLMVMIADGLGIGTNTYGKK